ncbi:type III secretion system inner rod subunit SctI [Morganella psychrotolerans]|uniref:type III secretion system inner rod subunit SctI n=1 Tax=Morganella psychrotolerans TaxID=368603 RepID=UPI0039AF2518
MMISAPRTHTLPLTDLTVSPEDNTFTTIPPAEETYSLKTLFDSFYQSIKQDTDKIASLHNSDALTSPDALLQTQLALAKIHFREELLAKTVGKVSQNIDMMIKSQ